jgi:SM-20-related protein
MRDVVHRMLLVPSFNTLDLFAVPQRHSVSIVTPSAQHRRYAVTGWLRKD